MHDVSLRELVGWQGAELPPAQRAELENRQCITAIRQQIEKQGGQGLWQSTRDEILRKTDELLDVGLLDICRRAWSKAQEIAKYRDREKYPPEATNVVPLADHNITSTHRPHLEVRVNEQVMGRVDFEVQIKISFRALRLHIQGGKIKRIDTGECQAEGSLQCEGFLLARRESKALQLPGTIDLGDGIAF